MTVTTATTQEGKRTVSYPPFGRGGNRPWVSFATFTVIVASITGLAIAGKVDGSTMTVVLLANIPGVMASIFSESVHRDVRNGVVTEKARIGASQAIADEHVLTTADPSQVAQPEDSRLIEATHALVVAVDHAVNGKLVGEQSIAREVHDLHSDTFHIASRLDNDDESTPKARPDGVD